MVPARESLPSRRNFLSLIYSGDDIDDYLALKRKKRRFVEKGSYDKTARRAIAYELGKLLSYPDAEIERLLSENKKREP